MESFIQSALLADQQSLYIVAAVFAAGVLTSLTGSVDRCTMNLTIDDLWGIEHWEQPVAFVDEGRRMLFPLSDQGTTWLAELALDEETGGRNGFVYGLGVTALTSGSLADADYRLVGGSGTQSAGVDLQVDHAVTGDLIHHVFQKGHANVKFRFAVAIKI